MTLLLVDANNVAMRSLHAMARTGLSADGIPTGPLLGFINAVAKHVKEERPRAVAVCWDGGRSERRVALDESYKAHRLAGPPEVEDVKYSVFHMAKEFCTLAGLHHVERTGYEADDLIAHYWRVRNPGERTVILSSDKDFLQLVGRRTEQVRLSSSDTATDRWTEERVAYEYGVSPEVLRYVLALAGDVSDNVPGVPRVGVKTAVRILLRHEFDWEAVLADPKVEPHRERVEKNLELVDLRSDRDRGLVLPPVPSFSPTAPGSLLYEPLLSFLTKYQMKGVQSRFFADTLWR